MREGVAMVFVYLTSSTAMIEIEHETVKPSNEVRSLAYR